ncbi:MAG: NADH-quinone oxidoreductase subunit N [Acidimicrobiales bacterium]
MIAVLTQVPLAPVPTTIAPASTAGTAAKLVTPNVPWSYLLPMLILFVGATIGLAVVAFVRGRFPRYVASAVTVVVAGAALVSTIPLWHRVANAKEGAISAVAGAVGVDRFSLFLTAVICVAVILVALLADGYLRREELDGPEMYLLMLMAASGGVIMASANDLIVLFIGLEILSISAYVMAAMHSRRLSSQEAGLKYFVLGAFASAFLLYGIALVYGAIGSTNLMTIQQFLSDHIILKDGLLIAGLGLMLVGFGFKVAAAPFHMWSPDVYQGAPTPVSAFMSSAVKVAAFGGMLRVFVVAFQTYRDVWGPIVFVLSILSLLVGSVMAVRQTNVKRMLAYSSINHAGFILVGVEAASGKGTAAALFYVASYTVMTIGSFGVVTLIGRTGDSRHSLDDYKGLGRSRPGLAMLFTIFLLAQAGTPFTAGFIAKFGVIAAAADRSHWALAAVAMVSATISGFLYLRIIASMYFVGGGAHGDEPVDLDGPPVAVPRGAAIALGLALVGTILLGVLPGTVADLTDKAIPEFVQPNGR